MVIPSNWPHYIPFINLQSSIFRLTCGLIYWLTMRNYLRQLYERCEVCQMNRKQKIQPPAIQKQFFSNLDSISVDFFSHCEKSYIVCADRSSVFLFARPVPDQTSVTLVWFVCDLGFQYGFPCEIQTESGP